MAKRIIVTVEDEAGEETARFDSGLHAEDDLVEEIVQELEKSMWAMLSQLKEWSADETDEEEVNLDVYPNDDNTIRY